MILHRITLDWRRGELRVIEHLEECPVVNREALLSGCWCRPSGSRRQVWTLARLWRWIRSRRPRGFPYGRAGW